MGQGLHETKIYFLIETIAKKHNLVQFSQAAAEQSVSVIGKHFIKGLFVTFTLSYFSPSTLFCQQRQNRDLDI